MNNYYITISITATKHALNKKKMNKKTANANRI